MKIKDISEGAIESINYKTLASGGKIILELHKLLSEKLCFPKFYGKNWDAFWDAITGLVTMPKNIIFSGWKEFQSKNAKDSEMLRTILNKYAEKYNRDFTVIYE